MLSLCPSIIMMESLGVASQVLTRSPGSYWSELESEMLNTAESQIVSEILVFKKEGYKATLLFITFSLKECYSHAN